MNQMFGMSIEQVRAMTQQLNAAAAEVEQILATLTTGLATTPWEGNDRKRFEDKWNTTHTKGLRNAADALRHAARSANDNVQAQINASGR